MYQFLAKTQAGCRRSSPRHLLHRITTLAIYWVCVAALQLFYTQTLPANQHDRPNVILIMADDQGWGDLSVNGNTNLATPNIDSLARDGAAFENFYVCAVCAPTRAEFLTGRYHPRTGVSGVSTGEGRLNLDETTVADIFKSFGYSTGAFGKWHNGTQSPYHPNDRGFDEFYGFTSGHWGHYFSPPLDHNGKKVRGNGYVVDDFTDHALAFIEANRDTPFFCYLPYNTPHSPMMVDDRFYEKFANVDPKMRHREPEKEDVMMTRAALAMCENIDWNVGRILNKLDDLQLRENTIVIYFSDNGPNSFRWNGGMKGKKGTVDEGGLRSPFLVRWPAKIRGGVKVGKVTAAIDLLPTLAALAGISPTIAPTPEKATTEKPIDGRDFSALLLEPNPRWEPRLLYSVWRRRISVRTERFRLDDSGRLFDITHDRGQQVDVTDKHPKEAQRLRESVAGFRAEMNENFVRFADRPFTVGYSKSTTLPARDGIPLGAVQRSSKAPNNSFFENWTSENASIVWKIETGEAGSFESIVHYTCKASDVGAKIRLQIDEGDFTESTVTEVFDPPLYDKSKERVANSHYFVKDFKPLRLGSLKLKKGRATLRLTAPKITGEEAMDVHSIELIRIE